VVADEASAGYAFEFVVVDEAGVEQEGLGCVVEGVERVGGERECPGFVGEKSEAAKPRDAGPQDVVAAG
jgi:hypothetical protein